MEYLKTLTKEFILDLFKKTDGLMQGHFKLSSGLHSNIYLQCAKVMQYPEMNSLLCTMIAQHYKNDKIDVVIGPAIGGITLSYEVARKLHCRSIFAERIIKNDDKVMVLRRGFEISEKERVLVVEDVITTGGSVKEVMALVEKHKGEITGLSAIVDRTNGQIKLHPNQHFLIEIEAETYELEKCPLCEKDVPLSIPGSKYL